MKLHQIEEYFKEKKENNAKNCILFILPFHAFIGTG